MIAIVAAGLLQLAPPVFAPPTQWARDFAAPGDFCFAGDIDGDGHADLIRVSPKGDAFIDVAVNRDGMKCLVPIRAISNWGKDCQDACVLADSGKQQVWGKRAGVAGIFGGDTIRLAKDFDGQFHDVPDWVKLPSKLKHPHIAYLDSKLDVWDESSGEGSSIDPLTKAVSPIRVPSRIVQIQQVTAGAGQAALFTYADGTVRLVDKIDASPSSSLGKCDKGVFPAVAHGWIFLDHPAPKVPIFVRQRLTSPYPASTDEWGAGDLDGDGDIDLVQFRFGPEAHSGHNILLHRRISPGETDSDHDGLTNNEELKLGTDPYNPDTDGDGLIDGWEVRGFRDLDLPAMGCDPKSIDVVCLVSRFPNLDKTLAETVMTRIQGYYTSLGWALHPVWLEQVSEADQKSAWWTNRDKFIPHKWRGIVHWMQVSSSGGGQADQLGDGGGCGGNEWSFYATFIHEFGHQLGLSHEGFYGAAWCPTYPSMMNYAYSYTYEDSIRKIRYSDGALKDYVLRETDLDETIPLPMAKVEFLAHAPYRYRLKAAGENTLIDWNWNGIFGEKHVRADINYSYSTTAGRRDDAGKTQSAPWVFTHGKDAYVLFAQHDQKPDTKTDPSVSVEKPGRLMLRRLIQPFKWAEPIKIVDSGVTGDPVAISYKGEIILAYPSAAGTVVRRIRMSGDKIIKNDAATYQETTGAPSLGVYGGKLLLFDGPKTPSGGNTVPAADLRYLILEGDPGGFHPLEDIAGKPVASTVPVGLATDTRLNQLIIGLAQDQDKDRPTRWQLRRYQWKGDKLVPCRSASVSPAQPSPSFDTGYVEWVDGEKGGARGRSRPIVLYDTQGRTGMKGRVLYFGIGSVSPQTPWSCGYVAQSIGDKTISGGWMVKRYFDEWTQSRSAPAACWFNGDILYAYRWADGGQGAGDNTLHVSYNGTGIENVPMADFDDIGYMKAFGIRNSILYLHE